MTKEGVCETINTTCNEVKEGVSKLPLSTKVGLGVVGTILLTAIADPFDLVLGGLAGIFGYKMLSDNAKDKDELDLR
ncbi:hypothetical protein FACS189487_00360 [Campylobacterota bacterium]|nr:hypothetical protein FACS189487_00360 [Campylobacterota bacterium]